MEDTPKISIIVPVYNVEAYLPQCLDSLINQTYGNLEIICINDGSPDGSGQILREYAARDSRVHVIKQENQGLSGARNTGLKYVTGEFIMFVDSDDWIDTRTCEIAMSAAKTNDADLVFWSYTREFQTVSKDRFLFWNDGEVFEKGRLREEIHRRQCGLFGVELKHPETADSLVTAWGKLYSTEKLRNSKAEFVDTKKIGTEDALFNLYALGYFERAVYIRKPLYHYRKTNDVSLTSSYKQKLPHQWGCLFDMMRDYVESNQLPAIYTQALQNRISLSVVGLGLNIMSAHVSAREKISMIKGVISAPRYREAVKTLELCYFPIHWKVFYLCAKWRNAVGVYALLGVIQKIIARG